MRRLAWVLVVGAALAASAVLLPGPAVDPAPAPTSAHTCNLCGTTAPFEPLGGRPDAGCPACKSRERHRLLMLYLERETTLFRDRLDVLHFAPNAGEKAVLRRLPGLNYRTADLERGKEDLWADLRAMIFIEDESWDVLIVYHVLEHILDDRAAMREMFRILRPGGRVFLQVPLDPGQTEIDEDASIVDPHARAERFGQWDHVRRYAAPGLRARLEAAGFRVEAVDYLNQLDPALVERHALRGRFDRPVDESIWIATRPRG